MPLQQHRLATDADPRHRPFFNMALVAWSGKLMSEVKRLEAQSPECKKNYMLLKDVVNKLVNRAKQLNIERASDNGKTTYAERLQRIDALTLQKRAYKKGAHLLFAELMRLMCRVRAMVPQVTRITDPNEAAALLHQSFTAMIDSKSDERKQLDKQNIKLQIGCGSSGEVFFEKHQVRNGVENIETYLFAGIFSDLFCAYVNNYVLSKPDGDENAQKHLAALLEFSSIHPCAEHSGVFDSDSESTEDEDKQDDDETEEDDDETEEDDDDRDD